MGVFGIPVTNNMLKGMPEYDGKRIGALDGARVALTVKNSDGKDVRARQYAEDLLEKAGVEVATLCLIYNATGNTIEYSSHKDWEGHLGAAPYPVIIQNGQWGAVLHKQLSAPISCAAVAYRCTNAYDKPCEWMLSWRTRNNTTDNRVYTEVGDVDYFARRWDQAHNDLVKSDFVNKNDWNDCLSVVAIGNYKHSIREAVLTLRGADKELAD